MSAVARERQDRRSTRARLMAAARSSFAELGIGGTSVVEVVQRAGFTRGAFYSNFDSIHVLVRAVLEQMVAEQLRAIDGYIDSLTSERGDRAGWRLSLQTALASVKPDPELVALLAELQLHATRDSFFSVQYAASLGEICKRVEDAVVTFARHNGLQLAVPAATASRILMSLWVPASTLDISRVSPSSATQEDLYLVAVGFFIDTDDGSA